MTNKRTVNYLLVDIFLKPSIIKTVASLSISHDERKMYKVISIGIVAIKPPSIQNM